MMTMTMRGTMFNDYGSMVHYTYLCVLSRDYCFIFQGTAMFLHWLVGMVYVFYFASFVLLLREVLRPGVLWFLRNLNDPDFHPVQEVRESLMPSKLRVVHLFGVSHRAGLDLWKLPNLTC